MAKMSAMKVKPKFGRADVRRRNLRDAYWPDAAAATWDVKTEKGWCTVPRTMPLVMTLINLLTPKDAGDASRVYFELWCRAFDGTFVELSDEDEHAFASGYTTDRGTRSWRERMKVLIDLGFIRVKRVGTKEYGAILLLHPDDVVEKLRAKDKIPEGWGWHSAYMKRFGEIGAKPRHHTVKSR